MLIVNKNTTLLDHYNNHHSITIPGSVSLIFEFTFAIISVDALSANPEPAR